MRRVCVFGGAVLFLFLLLSCRVRQKSVQSKTGVHCNSIKNNKRYKRVEKLCNYHVREHMLSMEAYFSGSLKVCKRSQVSLYYLVMNKCIKILMGKDSRCSVLGIEMSLLPKNCNEIVNMFFLFKEEVEKIHYE